MTEFTNRVYDLLRQVPKGRVTTYKALAEAMGTKAYQAIGQIMRNNPYAPEVPCHRVVKNNGSLGGFMGKKEGEEIKKKVALLKKEGVSVEDGRVVGFKEVFFDGFNL